jgi:hypothetical protein
MTGGRANIERLLRAHPDGLTIRQMSTSLQIDRRRVDESLKLMPHVYVDRWIAVPSTGQMIKWAAVYMLADIPENMPMPDWTPTEEDL